MEIPGGDWTDVLTAEPVPGGRVRDGDAPSAVSRGGPGQSGLMHEFRVWAPYPAQRRACPRRAADPDGAGRRRLVAVRGRASRAPGPTTPSASTAARRGPTRGRPSSRTASTGRPGWSTTRSSAGGDSGWRGVPLAGSVLYECHVGTFSARGDLRRGDRAPGPPGRAGHRHDRADAGGRVPGDRGWGYDGVDLFAPHHAYGGPDGPQAAGRRGARPRPRRGAGRRLQPPRPGRELPARVRPVLLGAAPDQLGRRGELRRPRQRRGAAVRHRQRPVLAARLPLRRAAPGRRARHRRQLRHPHLRGARGRGGGAGRARRPPAVRRSPRAT